jgi:hypothetical protein
MAISWLLVGLFVFHDGEEVLFLPAWVEKNKAVFDVLENRLPYLRHLFGLLRNNNQKQFSLSVLLLLLLLSLITGAAALFPSVVWIQNTLISATMIFTLHLIMHVLQSIFIKKIVPGAITSVLVFPASLYLWLHLLEAAKMSLGYSLMIGAIGGVILIPLFPLILKFGNFAGRSRQSQV